MPSWSIIVARMVAVLCVSAAVVLASSSGELPVDLFTLGLVLGAASVLCFSCERSAQAKAALFLPLVVAVQHATDWYYWQGVDQYGFPWPWQGDGTGAVIGSIAPLVGQVATFSSVVLAAVAVGLVVWHYKSSVGRVSHNGT